MLQMIFLSIPGQPGRKVFFFGPLIFFVASAFVGMWASYDRMLSLPTLLTLLGSVALFFAVANMLAWYRQVSGVLVIAATLLALYFVGQYDHLNYQDEVGMLARLGRLTGSLMPSLVFFKPHPNAIATFLEGPFLLSLALIWRARRRTRWAWGAAAAIIAYALLISGSRGAWGGLVIAIVIWLMLQFPGRAIQMAGAGLGLATGLLVGSYIVIRLASPDQHILILGSILEAAHSRLVLYQNSLHLLGDYPFTGVGLGGAFALVYSRYQLLISVPFLYYAHNLFLSVWLGQGVLGLAALLWLLIEFYGLVIGVERVGRQGDRETRRQGDSERKVTLSPCPLVPLSFFRAAWLGATATFIHGLIDSAQFSGAHWTMPALFVLLGLTVAIGGPALREDEGQKLNETVMDGGVGWRRGQLIVAIVGLIGALALFWWAATGVWHANLGAVYQTWADLSPEYSEIERESLRGGAVTYFERVLQMNPAQPAANRRLGMIALEEHNFDKAVSYLERAYSQEPNNQATLKTLGYASLWTGRLDRAEFLFSQLDFQSRLVDELNYWRWWWNTQERQDLSEYADEMLQRLSGS